MTSPPVRCPSCGAPATPGASTCRYCNSPLTGRSPVGGGAPAVGPSSLGYLVVGVIVVAAAVTAAGFWTARREADAGAVDLADAPGGADPAPAAARPAVPNDLVAVVPGGGDDDLLVYFYADERYRLARVGGRDFAPRWRAATAIKSAAVAHTVLAGDLAVTSAGERLHAHTLADGALRWEVGLVAEVQWKDHLRVVGDSVVAWQKDRSLQAFDLATGAIRWTRRTTDAHDQLPVVAGKLVVEDARDAGKFVLVDPATGDAGPPASVRCRGPAPTWPLRFDNKERVEPTADDRSLVLVLSIHQACVVRWDVATGKAAWTTYPDDSHETGWHDRDGMLLTDRDVLLAGERSIVALDLATGKERDLVRDREMGFRLRLVHEGVILAVQWPAHDTGKLSLWALDAGGARLWQRRLAARDRQRDWGLAPTAGGVVVWHTDDDEKAAFAERIDLRSGQTTYRQRLAADATLAPGVSGAQVTPRRAWLLAGGHAIALDLATGELARI
jgi:outer membrane protein assembly factor BamB